MTQRDSTALDLRIFLNFDGTFSYCRLQRCGIDILFTGFLNNYSSEIPCCVPFFSDRCTDKFPVLGCILWYVDFPPLNIQAPRSE